MEEMGLMEDSKGVVSPIEMEAEEEQDGESMDKREVTKFRGLVATANFLAQDRADVQFAVKEASRKMARPMKSD